MKNDDLVGDQLIKFFAASEIRFTKKKIVHRFEYSYFVFSEISDAAKCNKFCFDFFFIEN